MEPDAAKFERAIFAHIARMPSSEITGEGTLVRERGIPRARA